ncbi:nucleotide exchange factor GrpE [Longilinea arvoryzae]|uniref:nucleotide exchange factor GrpE n=1 Tax=Longilinea arvoryzae TaxID=360412 RepID=UPI001560472B|nr:nucleotide exchange factor GrpE [Longilinea arvoryzae]
METETTAAIEEKFIAENAALREELDQALQKAKENMDGWQRERADFMNYKKRIDREQATLKENITGEILKKYLVVVDDLERALKVRPTEGDLAAWSEGVELVYRKLIGILESEGVRRIPAETEKFDPSRHEAISHEDNPDHESDDIIEVVRQGYTIADRVLRPALVRVAR